MIPLSLEHFHDLGYVYKIGMELSNIYQKHKEIYFKAMIWYTYNFNMY